MSQPSPDPASPREVDYTAAGDQRPGEPMEVDYSAAAGAPAAPRALPPAYAPAGHAAPSAPPAPSLAKSVLAMLLGLAGAGLVAAGAHYPMIQQTGAPPPGFNLNNPFEGLWLKVAIYLIAGVAALFALQRHFFTFSILSLGALATAGVAYYMLFFKMLGAAPVEARAAFQPGLGIICLGAGGIVLLVAFFLRPRRVRYVT
jgi:hypothetical protein